MGRYAILISFLVCLAVTAFAGAEVKSIAPQELSALRATAKPPLVLDVRSPEEYEAGHIPGALHIPFDQVAKRVSEIEAPNGVAVYCKVGPRARKGEQALIAAGYTSVFHLQGGFDAWEAAGLPVERGE
jgi:rhodanese-related sulfurtransferase